MSPAPQEPSLELTVVLPCLNEARTIVACVREALEAMQASGISGEVLVADNGSTDGSQQLATEAGARVVPVTRRGYGNALRGGIEAAHGRYVLMGDADQSYNFGHLPRFLERLRAGDDLVMGNRFLGGIEPGAMPWKNRHIGNPILSAFGRILFRTPAKDFHCGLRAFSVDAYRRMDLRTTGMEFASEMVIKASLQGMRVSEVPTVLRPDKRGRPPHLRPWRDGWRHLRFMMLFSPRWLFLIPGLLLLCLGMTGLAALLPGPLHLGAITLDVHSLLFASTFVLLGFQSVAFSVLAKSFAIRAGLRPSDARFDWLMTWLSLESGLLTGLAIFLLGLGLSVTAVLNWSHQGFGGLDPVHSLRLVIPGGLCLSLGIEIILASFLLGVLGMGTRPNTQ